MKYDDFKIFKFSTISKITELRRYKISKIYKNINLNIPTPTANNSLQYKNLSDTILMRNPKMNFIKEKKENCCWI